MSGKEHQSLYDNTSPAPKNPLDKLDCEDFATQDEAFEYLTEHPKDWDFLDGDFDVRACEMLP